MLGAEHPDRVGADGVEADVPEVEQSGIPDDDVEAEATSTYVATVNSTPPKSEPSVVMSGMFSRGSRNEEHRERGTRG